MGDITAAYLASPEVMDSRKLSILITRLKGTHRQATDYLATWPSNEDSPTLSKPQFEFQYRPSTFTSLNNDGDLTFVNSAQLQNYQSQQPAGMLLPVKILARVRNSYRVADNTSVAVVMSLVDPTAPFREDKESKGKGIIASVAVDGYSDTFGSKTGFDLGLGGSISKLTAMMRKGPSTVDSDSVYSTYARLVSMGAVFEFSGRLLPDSSVSEGHRLLISKCSLAQCAWQPRYIEHLVQQVRLNLISPCEAARALLLTDPKSEQGDDWDLNLQSEKRMTDLLALSPTELRWAATEIGFRLQQQQSIFITPLLSEPEIRILEKYRDCRRAFPITNTQAADDNRSYVQPKVRPRIKLAALSDGHPCEPNISPDTSLELKLESESESVSITEAVPIYIKGDVSKIVGREGSWWQSKKKPQLQWMVARIEKLLRNNSVFEDSARVGGRKFRVLDIGGGKGALAMAIAQVILFFLVFDFIYSFLYLTSYILAHDK